MEARKRICATEHAPPYRLALAEKVSAADIALNGQDRNRSLQPCGPSLGRKKFDVVIGGRPGMRESLSGEAIG